MEIEIKSRTTGKVIYSFEGTFEDWNFKKKMLLMGREENKKLITHIEKYGMADLMAIGITEEEESKEVPDLGIIETEIIEPEMTIADFRVKHDKEAKERFKVDSEALMNAIKSDMKKKVTRKKK
jgi:hypothetical protein